MNSSSNRAKSLLLAGVSGLACALALSLPGVAAAQASGGDKEASSTVSEVVVTGSRIQKDGYEAPTPTTVVGVQEIERQSPANVADYVNQLPQLGGAAYMSPRTTSYSVGGASGGNSFNLRNLGSVRTLTLLDGKRVVAATQTGLVDTNMLPTNLVARVDVVTGGASAAWGSDAVAGVVNFVLDKNFEGLKGNVGYGESWRSDGATFNMDLAAGAKFADGRGHVLLSVRTEHIEPIDANDSRPWYTGLKAIPNPAHTATNGQPGFLAKQNAGLIYGTEGGVILFGPLAGVQFGPGGAVLPYHPATFAGGILGVGGDVQDIGGQYAIMSKETDTALFGRVSYDLTDHINVFAEISHGWDHQVNFTSTYIKFANLVVFADNPFIPAGLNLQGQPAFAMGRIFDDPGLGRVQVLNEREQERYVVGAEGDAPWFNNTFKWNAYYQHGKTDQYTELTHNMNVANLDLATDVVRNPAVGGVAGIAVGTPVCRSTLTNPTNGCVPFNPFGSGSASPAAIKYVLGDPAWQHVFLEQDVVAGSVQFDAFQLPAGALSVAAGLEYRKEQFHTTVDPLDATLGLFENPRFFGGYKLQRGSYDVKEGFVEVLAPLVRDAPFAKAIDFNGAVRMTNYSTSGQVTTWKAGATWDINDDFRLRATRSRDIRAPNLSDLYLAAAGGNIGVFDPITGGQSFVRILGGGNPKLVPEEADTTSYGVVFRPSWFHGFSASLDRYQIDIGNAIQSPDAQTTINLCYGVAGLPKTPAACNNITLGPTGNLAGGIVRAVGLNLASLELAGWDIELTYRNDLSEFSDKLPGSIDLRAVGSYLIKYTQSFAGTTYDLKGMPFKGGLPGAGGPEWRWLVTGTYQVGSSHTTLNVRYVGKGVVNNEPLSSPFSIDQNKIPSRTYIDLMQSFDVKVLGSDGQVFAGIQNLFDESPAPIPSTEGTAYASSGTDPNYYDLVGRTWRVGFRFRY